MAFAQGSGSAFVVIFALVYLGGALSSVRAVQHAVGGSAGWSLPSFVNVNYTVWADKETFTVGDTLLFKYNSTFHNVEEVSKADYANCSADKPLSKYVDGNTVIHLNRTGSFYFICGVPTHCPFGQKFEVNVLAASKGPAPSPSAGTSPSKSPVAAPSAGTSPSKSPVASPSSSTSPSESPGAVASVPSTPPSAATPSANSPAGQQSGAVASVKFTAILGVALAALSLVSSIC